MRLPWIKTDILRKIKCDIIMDKLKILISLYFYVIKDNLLIKETMYNHRKLKV